RRDATDLRLLAAIGDRTVCRLGPWGRRRASAEEERLLLLLFDRSLLLEDVGVADDGDLLLGQPTFRHHGGAGSRAHRGAELAVDLVGDVSRREDALDVGEDLVPHVDVPAGPQRDDAA